MGAFAGAVVSTQLSKMVLGKIFVFVFVAISMTHGSPSPSPSNDFPVKPEFEYLGLRPSKKWHHPDSPETCAIRKYWRDLYCDDENNTPECGYDGGDCCQKKVLGWEAYCNDCKCKQETNCRYGEWGEYGQCSKTCGTGKRTRYRPEFIKAQNGGTDCAWMGDCEKRSYSQDGSYGTCKGGSGSESQDCVAPGRSNCPIDCVWDEWQDHTTCTKSCEGGTKSRKRERKIEAQFGGKDCPGDKFDTVACNEQPCPQHCKWDKWGEWTLCTKSCKGGIQNRNRRIEHIAKHGGKDCHKNDDGSYMLVEHRECIEGTGSDTGGRGGGRPGGRPGGRQ